MRESLLAREKAQTIERASNPVVRDHGDATQAKLAALLGVGSADEATATSGSDFSWLQVGIGFALGIVLATGLWMGARVAKRHVPAH